MLAVINFIYVVVVLAIYSASTIVEVISSAIQTDVYYQVDKTPALIKVTLQVHIILFYYSLLYYYTKLTYFYIRIQLMYIWVKHLP